MRNIIAATGALLVVALIGWMIWFDGASPHATDVARITTGTAGEGDADSLARALLDRGAPAHCARTGRSVADTNASPTGTAAPTPELEESCGWLVLRDEIGRPIPGGRGVWVDRDLTLQPLIFSENGRARRPGSDRGHAYVRAEGFLGRGVTFPACEPPGGAPASETSVESVITLRAGHRLIGTVLVDGALPLEPITLEHSLAPEEIGIPYREFDVLDQLVEAGVQASRVDVEVGPGGVFAVDIAWEAGEIPIRVPGPFRVVAVRGDVVKQSGTGFSLAHASTAVTIELRKLGTVSGRFVWQDGTPAAGVYAAIDALDGAGQRLTSNGLRCDASGRFRVPVDLAAAVSESKGESGSELEVATLAVRAAGRAVKAMDPVRLEFEPARLPVDVGDVVLEAHPRLKLEVLGDGPEGLLPIEAAVWTGIERARTDDSGRVELSYDPAGSIEVLAAGYRYRRIDASELRAKLRIVLSRGADLSVSPGPDVMPPPGGKPLMCALVFEESPFESAHSRDGERTTFLSAGLYFASREPYRYCTGSREDPSERRAASFQIPWSAPLTISGLRPGAAFLVELMDVAGHPVAAQRVQMGDEDVHVEFKGQELGLHTAEVHLEWSDGSSVESGQLMVWTATGHRLNVDIDGGRASIGPILPCDASIGVETEGLDRLPAFDLRLRPGEPPHELVLRRP